MGHVLLEGLEQDVLGALGLHGRIEMVLLDCGVDRQLVRDFLEQLGLPLAVLRLFNLAEEFLDFAVLGLEEIDRAHGGLPCRSAP